MGILPMQNHRSEDSNLSGILPKVSLTPQLPEVIKM